MIIFISVSLVSLNSGSLITKVGCRQSRTKQMIELECRKCIREELDITFSFVLFLFYFLTMFYNAHDI